MRNPLIVSKYIVMTYRGALAKCRKHQGCEVFWMCIELKYVAEISIYMLTEI
jgi:hypothetical protein